MKTKFFISISLGLAWLAVSLFFAVGWAREISHILPPIYVWWVIIGIALLPGFLMSVMFFSNLMHRKPVKYPQTSQDISAMQNYDYLLSIAAVKRFQGSYSSTLVAQGAFSAFLTEAVRRAGGWQDVMGEDIVLTYKLIKKGLASEYEPAAAAYTTVPLSLGGLYSQRKRRAIGMLEGLRAAAPWEQPKFFSKYFTGVNLCVIYLDLAFLFGFIPGIILALMGYCYIVGILTLLYLAVSLLLYINMYIYRKSLKIPFENSLAGFIPFILFFQIIQSTAAVHGYITGILGRKAEWK